jgi:hypothetical protein
MISEQKNLFKSLEKFRCVHDVHRHFKSQMSVHHILMEKNCYPDGCIYFQWRCRLLAKQKKCFRNFEKVGKKCFNCKHFYEEKIHQYPEFINNDETFQTFLQNFDAFLEWINHLNSIRVLCEGRITSIKPNLIIEYLAIKSRVHMNGFLVSFSSGYIDNTPFEDAFYLSISSITQNKIKLRKDDLLEFEASLVLDKGRFLFNKSGKFHFLERGAGQILNKSNLLASLESATVQLGQPKKCLSCSKGVLADHSFKASGPNRSVVCLQGLPDYQLCTYLDESDKHVADDSCANPEWDGMKCNYTI